MAYRRLPIRVLIADDDPVFRRVLRAALRRHAQFKVVGEAETGPDIVSLTTSLKPDIVLVDLLMPLLSGFDAMHQLSSLATHSQLVVLCSFIQNQQILEALHLGARGVLRKRALHQVPACLTAVSEGFYWVEGRMATSVAEIIPDLVSGTLPDAGAVKSFNLTSREIQIIALVTLGETNREIGEKIAISEETVKRHLANIFNKVGMSTRLELAMFAVDHHLVNR